MRRSVLAILVIAATLGITTSGWAKCKVDSMKFATVLGDICYNCVFPFKIASIAVMPGSSDNENDLLGASEGVCFCAGVPKCINPYTNPAGMGIGITFSYWAPNRVVETTKDAWCFPFMGIDMTSMNEESFLKGTNSIDSKGMKETGHTFAQAHFWENSIWVEVMKKVGGKLCEMGGEANDNSIYSAYFTEIDPLWQDSVLEAIIEPEALLFANSIAQLACMAQALTSLPEGGMDMPLLFWCIGGGSAYPLAGSIAQPDYVQANQRLGARMVYRMNRLLSVCDTAVEACKCWALPIWIENHYRMQEIGPMVAADCNTLGRSTIIWGENKNIPFKPGGDNFIWMLYRKNVCCKILRCLSS